MSAPEFYPALNRLISTDRLPEPIKTAVDAVSNKLFYKSYYVEKSIYGESAYHHIVLVFNSEVGLNLFGGEEGFKLLFNPGSTPGTTEIPLSIYYNLPILKYIRQIRLDSLSSVTDYFNLIVKMFNLSKEELFFETIGVFLNGYENPVEEFVDQFNQNPSGISTLLLHGNTVNDSSGNTGFIQAAIFPVRYIDFDNNVVEDLVTPFLNANSIDMIISLSLNGSAYYFDLERFAAKNRGGFHDNMGIGTSPAWADPTLFSQINSSGNDFYQTTLPIDKIVTAAVANNFNYNGQKVFYDQSYTAENGNARPHVSATNGQPNANVNSFSINEIVENSIGGSGGAYLSNEIFYRISRLREILNSNVKTGHYHIAKATSGYFTMQESLEEVENAIKRSLSGI